MSALYPLTLWPKSLPDPEGGMSYPIATMREANDWAKAKRFTDAELAAEYWQSESDRAIHGYSEAITFILAEREIWHRFATLPHYDEVDL